MIFVDTSVFIAAFKVSDPDHQRASELLNEAATNNETLVTNDHVLDETITYLKKNAGRQVAFENGRRMLDNKGLTIEFASRIQVENALDVVGRIDGLSFCDALSVVMMRDLEIKKLYSFDSDFDRIKGLHRIG